jgi:hypothetical protein
MTFSAFYVLPLATLTLWALTGCEGKVRRVPDDLRHATAPNQPHPREENSNSSGAGSLNSSSDSRDGQQVPELLDNSGRPSSAAGNDSQCGGTGDAGACPPNSLCSPDAGAVCEATCPGCLIDGECVAVDALDPDTVCGICDPTRNRRGWSPNDGVTCDDGAYCTVDDACAAGTCDGTPRVCEDGVGCNGISTCNEATRSCSPDVNGCGNNALCNAQTDSCVTTCTGCVIEGVCLAAGTEVSGNPCFVCDPNSSTTGFTAAIGKSCGAAATACSRQDTCDGQGRCQPNDLPVNTPCGNPASAACDQPDTCDGSGNCQQRLAPNGSACDDGAFCTVGDQCQGGRCVATGNQNCGANRVCSEATDQCECQGCQVGSQCFFAGAPNPSNPCQVCDPNRARAAFSANTGASCGSGPAECSAQDTCNAQGQCALNNLADGTRCTSITGGSCQGGQCIGPRQPNGVPCVSASECTSGFCRRWFQSLDGDAHGSRSPSLAQMLCSPSPGDDQIIAEASGQTIAILRNSTGLFASVADDCCDSMQAGASSVFPGNTNLFLDPQRACPEIDAFDYDCSGAATDPYPGTFQSVGCGASCTGTFWVEPRPPCGQNGQIQSCVRTGGACGLGAAETTLRVCN